MRKKKKVTGKLYSRPSHKKQKEDPIGSDFAQWNSERSSLEKNCDVPQALNRKRIIRSQDYNRNLLKYLNNDRQRHASFCDLVVIVEGKEFNVHKVVVAVGSSYFHACLSKNPQADIVNLDHVSSLVFQHLLEFLYTSEFLILENEITSVLEAARFLDIIDAVKLLTTETDFSTTGIQPLLDVAHESITKLESSHKCLLCQRTFCYKKTLENHMGKVHGFGKTDIVSEDFDSPTRKSMRKRKCPVKFENGKEQGNDLSIEACKSSQYRMDSEESLNEEVQGVEESGQEGEGVEESSQEGEGVGESSQEGEGVEESSQENKGFEKSSQEGEGVEESRQGGEGVEERSQGAEGEKEISQGKKREEEISQREEKKEDSVQGEEGEEMDQGGEGEEEESEHEEEGEEEMSQRGEGEEEESEQEEEGEEEMGQGEEGEEESGQVEEGEEKELCFEDMEQSDGGLDEAEEANENLDTVGSYPDGFSPIVLQKSSKKILKCPKCEKVFDRMGKYESHIRVHTGEKPFECDICHQRYSTKSNLTVHKKRHNSETEVHMKEHKCPSCGKLHASKNTLGKHVKRFHPENAQEFVTDKRLKSEGWKCDICNKSFTRRPHLQEHMILHSQDKPFKCTYCEEHFKSRFPRLKHQEKYHLGPFPCDICGRQFNDTGNLKRHIEYTHGGKRKWTCFICGKSVRERTTLKEHLRIHSGEKPHLCSICGQNFRHGSSYRLHLRVHHDDKRYECNDCGKSFIRHDHLTKHRKIHSGEKEHQCEECGKCFGRRDHLTVHYKSVHLGEKVWQKYKATFHQCEVCKKVFKGKSSLDMHFRTHSGEKPYKCHICNQSFRIKKTLTKHLVIHSDARPFNCQYCNASFKRKDKLKYHIDHVHGSKAAEDGEEESREDPNNYPAPSQSVDANICMPLTLVPVEIAESEAELEQHPDTVLPTSAEYQRPTDLTFLEKYTLTPQPVTLLHPVRPEQIMESREHSYLGTLLGLDPPPPVQNIDTSNHH